MDPLDPHSRALRGAISVAVRAGDRESEVELRRELALCNIERALDREIGDQALSAAELHRLRMALDAHAADPSKRAAVARHRRHETEQLQSEIKDQIAELEARLAATQPVSVA